MSKDDKKKMADEIVDEVAAEMGVENEKVPDSDESADDVMAGLGGIFDVPSKKKKKKKKKPEPVEEVEESEVEESEVEESEAEESEVEEVAAAPAKKAKKEKSSKTAAVEGIFQPNADVDDIDLSDPKSYLDEDDLGGYAPGKSNTMIYVGIGAVLLAVAAGVILAFGSVDDVVSLFRGDLKERRIAAAKQAEDEFREKQLEGLDIFGNLMINGYPQYATVKLNGEVQYGQTSSEEWRAVRIGPNSVFQNIKVKEDHVIEVSSPGFEPKKVDLKRGMWQESAAGGDFMYQFNANLTPMSMEAKQEFDGRLAPDVDSDYFGVVTINTIPGGANVFVNNHPLVDKDGNPLQTPVTFEHFYKKDEKTGKLVEEPVRVDSVLDQGHKIQLQMPADKGEYPKHVLALQRQMWDCQWKSEDQLKKDKYNAETDSIQKKCNYVFKYDFSFDALKAYKERREQEAKEIEANNKKIQEEMAKFKKEQANK